MVEFFLLALLVLAGHFGWCLYCYNRINATGLRRTTIKRIELVIMALAVAIPLFFAIWQWPVLSLLFEGHRVAAADLSPLLILWAVWSIGCGLVLGPLWLESRLWLWPPHNVLEHREECVNVADHVPERLTGDWLTSACLRVPLNEITCLAASQKTLALERPFPRPWQALSIGHLSDLHFTGGLVPAYYHYVVERMQALQPDLIAVTGDIVDEEACLEWLEPILGQLRAPLGCHFVLGNHEGRLTRPEAVAERLVALGWTDLGVQDARIDVPANLPGRSRPPSIVLCGNERPWFERHEGGFWQRDRLDAAASAGALKIALAHSPDQHLWARELGMDLMLAGHTHGGQIRIPGLGPLVAPSWHGSRFASGVFRLPPTIMHVSRGLAGTQPLRWRCAPEISLLTVVPPSVAARKAERAAHAVRSGEPSIARSGLLKDAAAGYLDEPEANT